MKSIFYSFCFIVWMQNLYALDISVNSTAQLDSAFRQASAGTRIILLSGVYKVYRLDTVSGGTAENPIIVEAATPGMAVIQATGSEAISIHHPYWIIKGLTIEGSPNSEHAFHITNNADNVIIKENTLVNFHAQIKVNGENNGFPDNGLIENNDLFNTQIRNTDSPVTTVDIVAGNNWIIRGNYIADFAKGLSDKTSYGVFIKGNSMKGLIERNLVICANNTQGSIRVGMSFGGGGTGTAFCENQDCSIENTGGVMRNNIVLNCSDVGIYLNKARDTVITNNTLLMTTGIDVRFPESNAMIQDNILTGAIRERDGGKADIRKNVSLGTGFGMWLPSLSDKLRYRISNYDSQFPNFINRENVENSQNLIGRFFSFLGQTSLGLGQNKTQDCFPGLNIYDLKPNKTKCGEFWLDDKASSDNSVDFWGNKRSAGWNVMGAIDFYRSSCNLIDRIQHKAINLTAKCLN